MKLYSVTEEEHNEIISRLDRIEELMMERMSTSPQAATSTQKEVLTISDLVEYTGWTKPYIYQLTSKGEIPYYKPTGGTLFFKKSEIDRWLLRNRSASNDEISSMATTRLVTGRMTRANG